MLGKTRRARVRSVWYVLVWLELGSSQPRLPDTYQYPPRRLRSTKSQVRPTAGGYAPASLQRSRQLWPRPIGTRVRLCSSDMLNIFRYTFVAEARMLTVRSSADTRTNTARGRYVRTFRGRRPRRVYVAAARLLTGRSSTDKRNNIARGRSLGPRRGRSSRRVYRWQKRGRKTKQHSVRKINHHRLHNSIRRPDSTAITCAPECCTQSSIVPNVEPRTLVISPGPIANGLTQCRPPAEAHPSMTAATYASHASRSSLQQKHTAADESSPLWKECVCAHGNRVQRQKSRPPKRATHHAQAPAQANEAHNLLWISWEIPLTM